MNHKTLPLHRLRPYLKKLYWQRGQFIDYNKCECCDWRPPTFIDKEAYDNVTAEIRKVKLRIRKLKLEVGE